jgi:hypothetical protein
VTDPLKGVVDLELPEGRLVFVFLDVEPQTKLHKEYWRGWAEAVSSYTINAGTFHQPEFIQPFWPAIYCAMEAGRGPTPAVRDVFNDRRSPLCFAVATNWEDPFAQYPNKQTADKQAMIADKTVVQNIWPSFGNIEQPLRKVGLNVVKWKVPVVIWQYRININPPLLPNFSIDLAATRESQYARTNEIVFDEPITDYMLKIVW